MAKYDFSKAEGEVEITRSTEIFECGGCGYTILRRKVHFSEFQYYQGDLDPDPQYVPRHIGRQQPDWLQSLEDNNMRNTIFETVEVFNQEIFYLSAVGIRTVLGMILVYKVGDKDSFKAKLNELENGGHVTPSEKERLEVLVKAGSAAAHRGIGSISKILASFSRF